MAERFASDLGFILFVLAIAWLLGFLIAWLLRGSRIKNLQAEINSLTSRNDRLQADLDALQLKHDHCQNEVKRVNELNEALNNKLNQSYAELKDCEEKINTLELASGDEGGAQLLAKLDDWKSKYQSLQSKYAEVLKDQEDDSYELRKEIEALTKENYDLSSRLTTNQTDLVFDEAAARAVFGRKIKPDDLTIIEGIGPKIAELCHSAGVNSWYALSITSKDQLSQILENAGDRFRMHIPDTWPKQAEMAFKGEWKELLEYQEYLDGGKEPGK
jgi:predicted flap endonuclease-1-like 5' DNA nuclease